MKKAFFLMIALFLLFHALVFTCVNKTTSITKKFLNSISRTEQKKLESFFEEMITHDHFGFTLFGDKAISFSGYFNPLPIENLFEARINTLIKNGWEIWKKHQSKLPITQYFFLENFNGRDQEDQVISIMLINKSAFLKTIKENLPLFQQILGRSFSPEDLLVQVEKREKPLFDLLHQHEGLLGILLGYGKTNSMLFHRRQQLNIYNNHRSAFSLLIPTRSPDFDTIEEEIAFLSHKMQPVFAQTFLSSIRLPQFMGVKDSYETIVLKKKYQQIRCRIMNYYSRRNFLERTIEQLCFSSEETAGNLIKR